LFDEIKMKWRISYLLVLAAALVLSSCDKDSTSGDFDTRGISNNTGTTPRVESEDTRSVFILYSAGYNTLSANLTEDIKDVLGNYLPLDIQSRADNVLLIYSQHRKDGTYSRDNVESALYRASADIDGKVQLDTLVRYGADVMSASATTINNVLEYVKKNFPAKSYGLLVTSHGTGWVPPGYYNTTEITWESEEPKISPSSITQGQAGTFSDMSYYEVDVKDFAEAIPMKLDYLLFDACLMGGIETAYELRNVCKTVGFSQTEIMAEGFNYTTLIGALLGSSTPDPVQVCKDAFAMYDTPAASAPYCTISAVDCSKLEPLAEVCADLFEKYRSSIASVNASSVQGYGRGTHHWYYDLRDILVKANASDEDMARFDEALAGCMLYNAATSYFLEIKINTHCGLSMYLPANGSSYLNTYYTQFEWNKATKLVK